MALPAYASLEDRIWHYGARLVCYAVLLFLMLPILIIVPISFTSGDMLAFPLPGFSLRWYQRILEGAAWIDAAKNSLFIGISTTILAMIARDIGRHRPLAHALPLQAAADRPHHLAAAHSRSSSPPSPCISCWRGSGCGGTYAGPDPGPHRAGGTVRGRHGAGDAGGLRHQPVRAAASLGAPPLTAFRKVTLPIIFPGIASGGLFAFATSFDEIVVTLFIAAPEQRTLPRQIWSGVREYVSPGIAAVATLLILVSIFLLVTVELLRRRSERLRYGK